MMIIAVTMTLSLSPHLSLVFAVSIPVLALLLILILRKLSPIYGRMQRMLDQLNSVVQENLTAIRTVKSFVRGDDEYKKFSSANEDFRDTSQNAFHYAQLNLPSFQFAMYGTIVAILWFGAMYIHEGTLKGRPTHRLFELCAADTQFPYADLKFIPVGQPVADLRSTHTGSHG